MRSVRRVTATVVATASLIVLAACATEPSTPVADSSEKSLTLYAGRDEGLIGPLLEQFTEDTGIEVEVRYAGSTELNALLLEEGENTPADVFLSQDAGALGSLSKAGLLAPVPSDLADLIPDAYTSKDDSWIGVTGRARVIAYDGEELTADQIPDSVLDLTASEWNGRVGFPPGNASFQSFVTALRVIEGEDAADAWVAAMSENAPVLTEKNNATLDLVNSGELDLGLINHYYWFEAASEQGADNMRAQLKFLPGDAGGIVNVSGAGILAGAEGDPEAIAFIEYLVSEAGQRYFAEQTFEYPLLPGIDAPEGLPSLEELANPAFDLSDLDSLETTQQLLAAHGLI